MEKELSFKMLLTPGSIGLFFLIVISVGFISGIYPAIMLARQQPISVLKNNKLAGSKVMGIRNSLVISQFVISIVLIIGTIVLYKQLNFIHNKELGYQKENILSIPIGDRELKKKYDVFKEELIKHPGIVDVTFTQNTLENNTYGGWGDWEGKSQEEHINFYHIYTDYNFIDFFGINVSEGRAFSSDMLTDKSEAFILNKAAINAIGWNNPLDKQFYLDNPKGKVIGVVDDFHYQSLKLGIEPLLITMGEPGEYANHISVKVLSENLPVTLSFIENTYKRMSPGYQFQFTFLDSKLNDLYRAEQKLGRIFSIFTGIAFIVCILGLFGLASFIAKQRTKEIGIRKVNGAKIHEVLTMLNVDFIKWVIIAFIIACPIAYYSMDKWLENFAYKTEISWWIFALAGCIALLIALLTVSWQSWRAARRNPVEALRYE